MQTHHDHDHCIRSALAQAKVVCNQNNQRFTQLRQQVFEILWQSHHALGAYDVIEQLSKQLQKSIAPPTVYRALEFLCEQGLVHKVSSLNAFIGCCHADHEHSSQLLVCKSCQLINEVKVSDIDNQLQACASQAGFKVESSVVEILGYCQTCQSNSDIQPDKSS